MHSDAAAKYGRFPLLAVLCITSLGCRSVNEVLVPSNQRDWTPEHAVLPHAAFHGDRVTLCNIRNCQFLADDVYVVDYYDKSFDLGAVRAVDFIVVPFAALPLLAHTMLSFEIAGDDGETDHLVVSVEARRERNQAYDPLRGSARQYELMYVVADERDAIQLRTRYRGDDVYLYRATAPPETVRLLLTDVLGRINQLAREPEFYHTIANNCTTNILRHIHRIRPHRIGYDVRVLLPGYSDKLAYDEGLIRRHGSFAATKQYAYVTPRAQRYAGREDFSELIRRR
jgi:hypothetical protein